MIRRLVAAGFALLIAIILMFAALADSALAKRTTWVLRGAGFGHGIGMSQFGAQGFAKHGKNYEQILGHYYTDTSIGKAPSEPIRVILRQGAGSIKLRGASRASGGRRLNPRRTYTVRRSGGSIKLYSGRRAIARYSDGLLISDGASPIKLYGTAIGGHRNGSYRGSLQFTEAVFGGMNIVNLVDLDAYVQGVVPGEVPTSWHKEALKAQAVAARSYALATDAGGALFDQWPDTRSQVYRGADAEVRSTNAAVQATAGEVVKYKGKTIPTYFFSTSGGRTENVENVFYGSDPKPYLKSVEDPYDDESPRHRWTIRYSQSRIEDKLGGLVKGKLRSIRVTRRGVSPRVVKATVIGSRGRVNTTGSELRSRLGLYDTWVTFRKTRK